VDVWINNAAYSGTFQSFLESDAAQLQQVIGQELVMKQAFSSELQLWHAMVCPRLHWFCECHPLNDFNFLTPRETSVNSYSYQTIAVQYLDLPLNVRQRPAALWASALSIVRLYVMLCFVL
jgi:hypothetical protein